MASSQVTFNAMRVKLHDTKSPDYGLRVGKVPFGLNDKPYWLAVTRTTVLGKRKLLTEWRGVVQILPKWVMFKILPTRWTSYVQSSATSKYQKEKNVKNAQEKVDQGKLWSGLAASGCDCNSHGWEQATAHGLEQQSRFDTPNRPPATFVRCSKSRGQLTTKAQISLGRVSES